jgi:Ca-activated chloride channel family protein
MPGEVVLQCQVGKEHMPVTGGNQVAYVLIEAKPTALLASVRMPLNFALVLDHSGSMKGAKLQKVKEAVKMLVDQLAPTDYVSVIVFDDTAQVIVPAQPAIDKMSIKALVDRVRDGGGTTMSLGMNLGLQELRRHMGPGTVSRMILLTDGVTYGDTNRCRQLADEALSQGINIYPLGIGADWDEDFLDNIGQRSGGTPAEFIQSPNDALSVFSQQFQSASAVVVRNAVLTVRLPVGIAPRKAIKVFPLITDVSQSALGDRQIVVPLGDLERDTPQSVLVELLVDPKPAGIFRIAQAELSYDVPSTGITGERVRADVIVEFTTDPAQAATVNPIVMNFAEKANAHRLVTRVLDEYKQTGRVTTRLSPNVTRVLDQETQAALDALSTGQASQEEAKTIVKSIGNKTRKLTQRLDDQEFNL